MPQLAAKGNSHPGNCPGNRPAEGVSEIVQTSEWTRANIDQVLAKSLPNLYIWRFGLSRRRLDRPTSAAHRSEIVLMVDNSAAWSMKGEKRDRLER